MTTQDTLHLALRNLRQAKLRTALTVLGVSIGIASLTGMVSLGVGLQETFVSRFTQSGLFDAITVLSPGDLPGFAAGGRGGRGGRGRRADAGPRKQLDDKAIAEIAALPNVRDAYPNILLPVEIKYETYSDVTTASGVPLSARGQGAFQTFAHGAFFTGDGRNQCMLSLETARNLNDAQPGDLVGKTLTLSYATTDTTQPAAAPIPAPIPGMPGGFQLNKATISCAIVGIVERPSGPAMGGGPSNVMLPQKTAEEISRNIVTGPQSLLRDPSGPRTYNSLTVRVTGASATSEVQDRIKALGFNAISLNDALRGAKRAFIILDIMLSLIGSIALAVSSLGIVNTMVMSILERTREIGVMKAIGGSDGDIRKIFLVEASTIGLLGGVAGITLGWIVSRAINFGANIYIQSQGGPAGNLFSLPLWLIGAAIGFSWLVSLIAGSYPARQAARLDPIQALRHD